MKVEAYIEKSEGGLFSVYEDISGVNGFGDTEEEAKQDFLDAYKEFKEKGWFKEDFEFSFVTKYTK